MPVQTTCTGCKTKMRIPDEYANKTVKCPKCGQAFKAAPDAAPSPVAAKPSAAPAKQAPSTPLPAPAAKAAPAKTAPSASKPAPPTPVTSEKAKPDTKPAGKASPPPSKTPPRKKVEEEEVEVDVAEEEEVEVDAAEEEEVEVDAAEEEAEEVKPKKKRKDEDEEEAEEVKPKKKRKDEDEEEEEEARPKKKRKDEDAKDAAIRKRISFDWDSPLLKEDPFEETDLSEEAREIVEGELTKTEKLVWVGRTSRDLALSDAKIGRIACFVFAGLAGVLLLVGLILLFVNVLVGVIMVVFALLFGGVATLGIIFLGNPAHVLKCRAIYALTTRRCLVWANGDPKWMESQFSAYTAFQVEDMERKGSMRKPSAGDLIFAYELEERAGHGRHGGNTVERVPKGFLKVDDVADLEDLIRQVLVNKRIDRQLS